MTDAESPADGQTIITDLYHVKMSNNIQTYLNRWAKWEGGVEGMGWDRHRGRQWGGLGE